MSDYLPVIKVTNAHHDPLFKNKAPQRRVICSNCESHLGYVYDDGPHPFRKRFQVNSASLNFQPKPWQKEPLYTFAERVERYKVQERTKKALAEFKEILKDEELMGFEHYKKRQQ
mmetsp:Transcript_10867/g.10998  ORF Transcript_10867/g.10998 Transcript_10867/m.10998 type:complete len:115 (-) Transcript_10867:130-474(-)|eukprot:CAMPEP_0170554222 /NCGR_PEP_ID=MMETSP0211-20121228/12106_1 /TAXON_ID=311385 /ORGANISM="Pseudokeronopsis sp., Strain OXSARD2" /LENGTH=114 /DNA_ID=CAMNT_0010863151 /DNA_START=738 /DNA_END=1082 /DNA_ORIENTATION=-